MSENIIIQNWNDMLFSMNTLLVTSFLCFVATAFAYNCTSCPTSLTVVSGSEPVNQYPGTNQYNCSDITLRCANPNGGYAILQFYNQGSLVITDYKCGIDYETVMCSTEGYQWVQINGTTYHVDSVHCGYYNYSCNSTSTTQKPPSSSNTTVSCNKCPTSLAVLSGSEPVNQYPGTNQYNCSDITLRCANPNGGGVSLQFYNQGSLAITDYKCGIDYETVMCSTEGYQWVQINGNTYHVDSVHCIYSNYSCNSTSTTQKPPSSSNATYSCNKCPTSLAVLNGSEPVNQYPGTNQYNCSDITLRCANPNGGYAILQFYNQGSLVITDYKCGIDYETVMCSTEGYQWVQINGQTYHVDSVHCGYYNYSCNSTATTQSPHSTTKATYSCNKCPTSLTVLTGSEPVSQYPGTNQYNCSDITLRCANPNGGGVSFQFYNQGSLAITDYKCGIDYETVMCSTEGYQWVQINGQTYHVDSVHCIYSNYSCNSTSTTQKPPSSSNATYSCNKCPTSFAVLNGSEPINQYPGTNQYNCSDITLRCANPNGGGVSLQFYNQSNLSITDNTCGVAYATVMCVTEGYQWVQINGQTYYVNSVHCSYSNYSCNSTSATTQPPSSSNATYSCNKCPTSLAVLNGSEPVNQYPGTNQYNCSDITLRCANPNGGYAILQFYNQGYLAVTDYKCGVDYETVMCSTEGYQWVQINGTTYHVDSVHCSYYNYSCSSASSNSTPSNSVSSTQNPPTTINYIERCNSCPKNITVESGSLTIAQYAGVNQWNCSDIILRCASPSGGSVTLKFYENGTEVTSASATNGTIYETINCSSEAYQWVSINGTGIKTNAVSCSSP